MAATNGFIGRERELADLTALLDECRLITLLGPGGVGKTRLAVETSRALAPRFVGGVLLSELVGTSDRDDVASVVARQLGVDTLDAVLLRAADEPTLVVLDNCESAPVQAAAVTQRLLDADIDLRVLATSRTPLRVADERVFPVAPLGLPTGDGAETAAVRLFLDRADGAGASWPRSDANLEAVATLVHRLDGLPLAIELAAARSRLLAPSELLDLLEKQLDLLRRPQIGNDRHHSLRTAIQTSYEPLAPDLQRNLRQLAVLPAAFDLELAHGLIAPDGDELETLEALGALVDTSLVDVSPGEDGRTRYRLLDSIRAFGLEALEAESESDEAGDRYADAMVAFADKIGREAQKAFAPDLLDRIRRNFAHLASAIAWCIDHDEGPRRAYRMFLPFYGPTGARAEVTELANRIRSTWTEPARLQAEVWAVMATSFFLTGDYGTGRELAEQAVDHPSGSPFARVVGHRTLGFIDALNGRSSSARSHLEQAIELAGFSEAFVRELEISWAAVVVDPTESPSALEVLTRASASAALNDEKVNVLWAAVTTAFHRVLLDDLPGARRAAEAAVAVADRTGLPWSVSTAHRVMGSVLVMERGWEPAAPHFRLAIETSLTTGDIEAMATALRAAAGGARYLGDHELATSLWATIPPLPGLPVLRSIFHEHEAQLMTELGPPTALDPQTLVVSARSLLGPPPGDSSLEDQAAASRPQSGSTHDNSGIVRFGDYEIDSTMHELRHRGSRVHLEPQVYDVLAYLVERRPALVTKNELLDNVWGDRFVSDAALSSRIAAARKATGDDGKTQAVIRTVHGKGFLFVAEVED